MPRVRKGAARAQARKRILRKARGYYGVKSRHKYQARNALIRAGVYQFRDRRRVKRDMRRLWVTRITAACRMRGTRYSLLINGLKLAGIDLNRKMLSLIAIEDPKLFDKICAIGIKFARGNGGGAEAKLSAGAEPAARRSIRNFMDTNWSGGGGTGTLVAPSRSAKSDASGEGDIMDIEGVGPAFAKKLKDGAGITWIKQRLDAGKSKAGRVDLAAKTGIREAMILSWVNMADMMRIGGVDGDMAELMHAAGVDTVKELAPRVAANLAAKMGEVNTSGKKAIAARVPGEQEVAGWIDQAKKLAPMVTH